MTTNFAALHMSAPGTVLTKPDLALCPQLARADIRPVDGNSGCDPGWVNTCKFLLFAHSDLLPVLSSRVCWLDNFSDAFCSAPS